MPDTNGNPVSFQFVSSADGNRAIYSIAGGTSIGETGSFAGVYLAERREESAHRGDWRTRLITPSRSELAGPQWNKLYGNADLSAMTIANYTGVRGTSDLWHLEPEGQPQRLFEKAPPEELVGGEGGYFGVSADGTRTVAMLEGGTLDPSYPAASSQPNLYDISSGAPRLVSLLPGGSLPPCGIEKHTITVGSSPTQQSHWVSGDGSLVFFQARMGSCSSEDQPQLFMRDLTADETVRVSVPPLSGPTCVAPLIKATPGAAFFTTASRLTADDTNSGTCNKGNDIYRYDTGTQSLECLTCQATSLEVNVLGAEPRGIGVSDSGSRVYFSTSTKLLPGAQASGYPGLYRLDVASGSLAYIAPLGVDAAGNPVEDITSYYTAISVDGKYLYFRAGNSSLNQVGGANGSGFYQYYLYNDGDGSLECVSCPQDGSSPSGDVYRFLSQGSETPPLSANGTVAFATTTPLVAPDQNTSSEGEGEGGTDIYEWRDGRQLLVTDGLTHWPPLAPPAVNGLSPDGRDLYFRAFAQYTPDALDAFTRIYDARIGGGFEFAAAPKPCPLEVCQGTPKGAPTVEPLASLTSSPGNVKSKAARCRRHKVRRHGRCVARKHRKHKKKHRRRRKHRHIRANHRRTAK